MSRVTAQIDRLLADLTEPQREAVLHVDGPLLILAGPGSGKTRVVTRRAAHLALVAVPASHILAITFTNKAAREMQERINALGVGGGMTVGTFHALCARLLRVNAERAGVSRHFAVVDRDDRRKLVKQAIEECDLSTANWSPAAAEAAISRAKNEMVTADQFAESASDWRGRTLARVYGVYEVLLARSGGLDFDDLLMRMARLLADDGELRDALEERYRYVLIDEYQDTNATQYSLVRRLTERRRNLCATGDPDQSIYGWRGANVENILSFERDYPSAKVVRLEQNYRSTQRIVACADALISGNLNRRKKSLWTENDTGIPVRVIDCLSGEDEAAMVARDIADQIQSGAAPEEIAVFYRINSLSRVMEEALIQAGIRYQIARGVEFYNRKEIKDVLAYLRVLINPADEVSLRRIVNTPPRGIGGTTLAKLADHARATRSSLIDVLRDPDAQGGVGRVGPRVQRFVELLRTLQPCVDQPAPRALEQVLTLSGLRAMYREAEDADNAPLANLDELVSAASVYQAEHPEASLVDWLEHTALVSDVDQVDKGAGKVTLMTLHAAKGLEFDSVHIVGLEEGLLPFRRRDAEPEDPEEERRLFFVGMTRARKRLTVSHARFRLLRGLTERAVRSPFLDELPESQIEWVEPEVHTARRRGADFGARPAGLEEWSVGTVVRHPQLGIGQVSSIHRTTKRTHVSVQFPNGSQRSWILEFAPLTRVDADLVD